MLSIVVEAYKRSTAIVPLSALMALWASGKGMQAITNGLNTIYHVKETRNWLMTRIYSVFYMLLFVLAIIVTLLVLVLGNRIQVAAQRTIPILGRLLAKVIGARTLLVCIKYRGSVSDVTAAVEAGMKVAESMTGVVQHYIIPNPEPGTQKMLKISALDKD